MSSEIYSYVVPLLFDTGALDVYLTSIMMKKNRPGIKISILCSKKHQQAIEDVLFKETSTLGIRNYPVLRSTLDRKFIKISTSFGDVSLKVALRDGKILKYSPEYKECQRIAKEKNLPLQKVYHEIMHAAKKYLDTVKDDA